MIKEYKTISEVVGPLMLVKDVENVTYDELGRDNSAKRRKEAVQGAGGKRKQRSGTALRELYRHQPQGEHRKILGKRTELPVSPDILGRVFDGMDARKTAARI
mgnify:CR=1 FL=1